MKPPIKKKKKLSLNLHFCRYNVMREIAKELKFRIVETEEYDSDIIWTDTTMAHERFLRLKHY